jgi:hypothetical protein
MAGIDLSKMDAMARKMDDAVKAFHKAIENGDANTAGDLLNIIKNTSSFLSEDLYTLIQKAEPQHLPGVTQFVNGVPIAQHQEVTHVFDVQDRDAMIKGLIMPSRTGGIMRPQRGPGQYIGTPPRG